MEQPQMVQMESSPACSLCAGPDDPKKPKMIYGHLVCKKCYYSFANRRQLAFFIDSMGLRFISTFLALLIVMVLGVSTDSQGTIDSIDSVVTLIALMALFCKDGFSGYSPGKAICGVRVIDEATGEPAAFGASFKRNLPLLIPFMPIFVAFQLCNGHRLGDAWSTTKVIWKKYESSPVFAPGRL